MIKTTILSILLFFASNPLIASSGAQTASWPGYAQLFQPVTTRIAQWSNKQAFILAASALFCGFIGWYNRNTIRQWFAKKPTKIQPQIILKKPDPKIQLPEDMLLVIFLKVPYIQFIAPNTEYRHNGSYELRQCLKIIKSLACVNKKCKEIYNTIYHSDESCLKAIKILSFAFNCSDEAVVETLKTPVSLNILARQSELLTWSYNDKPTNFNENNLKVLDLDFTYDDLWHGLFQFTPLMIATRFDSTKQIETILQHNPNLDKKDKFGQTALNIYLGYTKIYDLTIVQKLCTKNIVNNKSRYGETTPLMSVIWQSIYGLNTNDITDTIKIFLENGANPELKDKHGRDAFDLTRARGSHTEVFKLLEAAKEQKQYK